MIPTARANAGGVAETALHFVGERDRGDQFAAIRADALRDRERGGDVIARVRRLFRKIGVVVIEIANATAGRERRPIRRRLVIGADDRCAPFFAEKSEATLRAITHGSSFHAPSAQPKESITRRFTSCTTSGERSS